MKKLLTLLALLPLAAFAQDTEQPVVPKPHQPKNELTLNAGFNFQPEIDFRNMNSGDLRMTIGYMRNFDKLQIGARIEVNTDLFGYVDCSPVLLANKKFMLSKSYLYAGSAVGYFQRNANVFGFVPSYGNLKGYVLGLQGGGSFYMGEHFSFTSEIAVRSVQTWYKQHYYEPPFVSTYGSHEGYYYEVTQTQFILSFPVTIGVSYRF